MRKNFRNNSIFLDCPISTSTIESEEDDPDYPTSNVLADLCLLDGSKDWRGRGNNSHLVIELGCPQDIKSVWIKNGLKDYQTENFTISVATHPKGPWKQVLNDSLPPSSSEVRHCLVYYFSLKKGYFKGWVRQPSYSI